MVDLKRTKSSHVWDNVVLIDCEKLKVVIKKAMSEVNNMEQMHDEFSAKSFLQSDGGITGLLSSRKPWKSWENHQKGKAASKFHCP